MGGSLRLRALGIPACLALALALLAPTAHAASPLKIREAFPGSTAAGASAEFVELQMTADGQSDIDGQVLRFYGAAGTETSSFTIPSDVANGSSQRTVLLATTEAAPVGAGSPDFTLTSADRMNPAGGALCFTGGSANDCLSWGPFPPNIPFQLPLIPDPQSANATALAGENAAGQSWTRDITRGCSTLLDLSDDTGSGANDFDPAAPTPRSNSVTPTEIRCPPAAGIISAPDSPTNKTSASLTYAALPTESGVSFQCHLDSNLASTPPATPPTEGEWEACNTQPKTYSGLSDGFYRFWVRAKGENPSWGAPTSRSWQLDATAPQTSVSSSPPEPSSGFEAAFGFSSSEEHSSFRCQLDDGAIQICANNATSGAKSYFNLTDGPHVFRVWATDNAGNQDPTPAEKSFTVFTPLGDLTAPDTSIISSPSNPSLSSAAFFAYASSEPGSTFQCRLSNAAFAACPEAGMRYSNLRNGTYSFEARAIDRAGNVDSIPASVSWRVAALLPETTITKAPPGRISIKGRKTKVTLAFKADKAGSSFRCLLDNGKEKACKTPLTLKVKPGRHRFEVHAIDSLGNAETTPARRIFRVVRRGGGGLFG